MLRLLLNRVEMGRAVLLWLAVPWASVACKVESSRFLPTGTVESGPFGTDSDGSRASSSTTESAGSTGHGEGAATDSGATEGTGDRSTGPADELGVGDEQGATEEESSQESSGLEGDEGVTTGDIDGKGTGEVTQGDDAGSLETTSGTESDGETVTDSTEDSTGSDGTEDDDTESGSIPDDADWTEKSCRARVRLTLDARALVENFESLAVPLTLDGQTIDLTGAMDDGLGLRVVDPDDGHRLAHDVEGFDPQSLSWLWLRVNKIEAGQADRYYWLYFDCDSVAGISRSAVWDTQYDGVWHLNADYLDAGPRERHGYDHGTSRIEGIFAEGRRFWGDGGHVHLGVDDALRAGASMSVWVNYERLDRADAGDNPLISCGGDTEWSSDNYLYKLSILDDRRLYLFWEYGDGNNVDSYASTERAPIAGDQWHHIAVARDSDLQRIYYYVDGVLIGDVQAYVRGPEDGDESSLWIGAAQSDTSRSYFGLMDEVRVSRQVFDAKHFRGEVAAQRALTWQIGDVESR